MISYDLQCAALHRFEGWFGSSADYGDQLDRGLIQCPVCGIYDIRKLLSAPNVARKSNQAVRATIAPIAPPMKTAMDTAPPIEPSAMSVMSDKANSGEISAQIGAGSAGKWMEKIAHLQEEMLKQSQWVGKNFAEESRAIHYGETTARPIHGETTAQDAQILIEEGIRIAPLLFPYIPDEAKN